MCGVHVYNLHVDGALTGAFYTVSLCKNLVISRIRIIQICSRITRGGVLNGELYVQRFQKLIYLHLFTDCFK